MKVFAFGEPHSLRRYIEFGTVAGVLAGILATVLGVSLPLIVGVAAAIVGVLGGHSLKSLRLSIERLPTPGPVFVGIAIVIFVVGFAVLGAAYNIQADSGMWVLLALAVACFGALIATNWEG